MVMKPQLSIVHVTTININSLGNISHYLLNALYSSGVAKVIGYTMQLTSQQCCWLFCGSVSASGWTGCKEMSETKCLLYSNLENDWHSR